MIVGKMMIPREERDGPVESERGEPQQRIDDGRGVSRFCGWLTTSGVGVPRSAGA
jgi:hypothetical protein